MNIKPFALERYFAKYEFSTKYLLSSSDSEGLTQAEVLAMSDPETRELWNNLKLGYTESPGLFILREEITKLYQGVTADDVLLTVPEEGIFIALNCLLNRGDNIICTYPGYQSLYEIAASLGCEVTKWQPQESNGWQFKVAELENLIKPNTKLLVINFPHNPTGFLPTKSDFEKIFAIARAHNLYVFSDEMYRFLEYNTASRLPAGVELYNKAVSLFGMSKTFGMAGVRTGWLITKDKNLYQKFAEFKDYTTICSSAPSEILTLIALRNRDAIISRHLSRLNRNLHLLDQFINKHKNFLSWSKPQAGTVCFPRLRGNISSEKFCQEAIDQAQIMILPSVVYNYDDAHIRVGFGRENFPEVLQVFDNYLNRIK